MARNYTSKHAKYMKYFHKYYTWIYKWHSRGIAKWTKALKVGWPLMARDQATIPVAAKRRHTECDDCRATAERQRPHGILWCSTCTLWLCQNSYWKWPFIVDFPMKNGDFPVRYVTNYQRVSLGHGPSVSRKNIAGRKIWYVSMGHMSTNGYQVVVGVLEL